MSCSTIQISQTLSQIWAQTVSVVTDSFPNPTGEAPSLILRGQSTGDTEPDSVTPGDSGSGSLRFRQDLHPCEKRCALSILSRGEMGTKQVLGEQQTAWGEGGSVGRENANVYLPSWFQQALPLRVAPPASAHVLSTSC